MTDKGLTDVIRQYRRLHAVGVHGPAAAVFGELMTSTQQTRDSVYLLVTYVIALYRRIEGGAPPSLPITNLLLFHRFADIERVTVSMKRFPFHLGQTLSYRAGNKFSALRPKITRSLLPRISLNLYSLTARPYVH